MPSETTPFSYNVEVSGWDSMHNFFVEKAPLELLPGGLRRVRLRAALHPGAMIFLRTGEFRSAGPALPEACRVDSVSPVDRSGFRHLTFALMDHRKLSSPMAGSPTGLARAATVDSVGA